jgi:hypothetical protein
VNQKVDWYADKTGAKELNHKQAIENAKFRTNHDRG